MSSKKRTRRIGSVRSELISKSREAALSAVQIFNNPQILFKSELFIVTMNIAWTYLLHSYYRKLKIEYRYFRTENNRRTFDKTRGGAYKYWDLEKCLNHQKCPLDNNTKLNIKFLMGIRHEIEHQMTQRIDGSLSAKFQANCLNFNRYIKKLFGNAHGIDKHLAFSLQFSSISKDQISQLDQDPSLPRNIDSFIRNFENDLTDDEYNSSAFAYRVLFVAKTANHRGQADQVIEFVKAESDVAKSANQKYAVIKETERRKYTAGEIVKHVQCLGFKKFRMYEHTQLWKKKDGKNPSQGYGVTVAKAWYWYESWRDFVESHCKENSDLYR
ncbi:MAG: hypothetical protein CL678_18155 [Bdellovibrionaceae bacterium]|nr:hypothetical protein [Pseudobdellovibrionaceae bacterium]